MKQKNISTCLKFNSICFINERLWFMANNFNALCYMDWHSHLVHYVGAIPDEPYNAVNLYADIKYCCGKLVLTPLKAEKIAVYDLEKNTFQTYALKMPRNYSNLSYAASIKFAVSVVRENRVYLIGRRYPAIVELNVDTGEIRYYEDWADEIQSHIHSQAAYFQGNVVVEKDTFFAASFNSNTILEFNMETKKCRIHIGNEDMISYSGIARHNNELWLADRDRERVYVWDMISEKIVATYSYPNDFQPEMRNFLSSVKIDKQIYYITARANMLLRINPEMKKITCIKCFDAERNEKNKMDFAVCCAWEHEGNLYYLNNFTNCIEAFDRYDCLVDSYLPQFSETFWQDVYRNNFDISNNIILEDNVFTLEGLIKYL